MVLFIILALILIFVIVFTVFAIGAGGAVMVVVFGDVIVCAVLIGIAIRFIYLHWYKK